MRSPSTFSTINDLGRFALFYLLLLSAVDFFWAIQFPHSLTKSTILLSLAFLVICCMKARKANLLDIKSVKTTRKTLQPQIKNQWLDWFLGLVLTVLTFPALLLIAVLILFLDRRSAIFCQQRVGLNGVPFFIYKFRTLDPETLKPTGLGRILRSTNLDELPQLFNVLKGEMSMVGPRPELLEKAKLFSEEENKRHLIRPGITGYWQLSLQRSEPIVKNVELDMIYLENPSVVVDVFILLATPFLMFRSIKRQPPHENSNKSAS